MRPLPCRHLEWGTATVRPDGETKRLQYMQDRMPHPSPSLALFTRSSRRTSVGPRCCGPKLPYHTLPYSLHWYGTGTLRVYSFARVVLVELIGNLIAISLAQRSFLPTFSPRPWDPSGEPIRVPVLLYSTRTSTRTGPLRALQYYPVQYSYEYSPTVQHRYSTRTSTRPLHQNCDHKCFCIETCFAFLALPVFSVRHAFAVCHKMWLYRRDAVAANLPKNFKLKKQTSRTIFRGDVFRNDNGPCREYPKVTGCRKSRL